MVCEISGNGMHLIPGMEPCIMQVGLDSFPGAGYLHPGHDDGFEKNRCLDGSLPPCSKNGNDECPVRGGGKQPDGSPMFYRYSSPVPIQPDYLIMGNDSVTRRVSICKILW